MGLHLRIGVWLGGLVIAAALGTGLATQALLVRQGQQARREVARAWVRGFVQGRGARLTELEGALKSEGVEALVVLGLGGEVVARVPENAAVPRLGDDEGGRVTVAVDLEGEPRQRVLARLAPGFPPAGDARGAAGLALFYALLNGAVVLLVALAIFARRVTRPLGRMLEHLQRSSEGDLRVALERIGEANPDAVGQLGASLRRLLGALAEREASLRDKVEALERTQAELVAAARLATVGRLSAGVAHEIGNPLAAVKGLVEIVAEGGLSPEEREDALQRIARELTRVDGTVRGLLDYARQRPTELGPVALEPVVREAIELVRPQRRGITPSFDVALDADLPAAHADPERLRQVLVNLLLNAVDAVREQPAPLIRVAARPGAGRGRVELAVSDNGPGVPAAERARVFEPFVTTKPRGEGTGLGLAVSLDLVEAMGGRLGLGEPDELGGARFVLELRAAAA